MACPSFIAIVLLTACTFAASVNSKCPAASCSSSKCLLSCSNLGSGDAEGFYTIDHGDGNKSCVYCAKLASYSGWWHRFGQNGKGSDWSYDKYSKLPAVVVSVVNQTEAVIIRRLNVTTVRIETDVQFVIATDRSVNPSSVTVVSTASLRRSVVKIPKAQLLIGQCSVQFPKSSSLYDGSSITCTQSGGNANCGTGGLPATGSSLGPLYVEEVNIDPRGSGSFGLTWLNTVTWKGTYYYVYVQEPAVVHSTAAATTSAPTTRAAVTSAAVKTAAPNPTTGALTTSATTTTAETNQISPTTNTVVFTHSTSSNPSTKSVASSPSTSSPPTPSRRVASSSPPTSTSPPSSSSTTSASFMTANPILPTSMQPNSTPKSKSTTTIPSTQAKTAFTTSSTTPKNTKRPTRTPSVFPSTQNSLTGQPTGIYNVIDAEIKKLLQSENIVASSSNKLDFLAKIQVTAKNAQTVISLTADICTGKADWIAQDVNNIVDILDGCIGKVEDHQQLLHPSTPTDVARDVARTVNDVLSANLTQLDRAQKNTEASTRIVHQTEKSLHLIKFADDQSDFSAVYDRIATQVLRVNKTAAEHGFSYSHVSLLKTPSREDSMKNDTAIAVDDFYNRPPEPVVAIQFPEGCLQKAIDLSKDSSSLTLSIAVYQSDKFFPKANASSPYEVNSRVISASFSNLLTPVRNLDLPVLITFRHMDKCGEDPRCVYWQNVTDDIDGGYWSREGCEHRWTEGEHTTCACNHLTNFALLMNLNGPNKDSCLSESHKIALTIITYIGCGLSLLGIFLLLFTYIIFPKQLKHRPQKILLNLAIALAGVIIVFLAGIKQVENPAVCKATGALIHYFLLAALCWMGIEAFHLYLLLVLVFSRSIRYFTVKFCIIGWGIPAIIVGATLAVSLDNYGGTEYCHVTTPASYYAFFGPAGLILAANLVFYILIVRSVWKSGRHSIKLPLAKDEGLARARASFVILTMTGITWILGFFTIRDTEANLVFSYLFAICNTLQGFFIFLFHCLLRKDVRTQWSLFLRCKGRYTAERASTIRKHSTEQPRKSSVTFEEPRMLKKTKNTRSGSSLQSFMPSDAGRQSYSPLDALRRWKERRSLRKKSSSAAPGDILLELHRLEGARLS